MGVALGFTFLAEVKVGADSTFESNTGDWLHSTVITPSSMNNIIISFTLFLHALAVNLHSNMSWLLFNHNYVFSTLFTLYFFDMFLCLFLQFNLNGLLESFWHDRIHKNFRFFVVPTKKNVQIKISLKHDLIIILIEIVDWVFFDMRVHLFDKGMDELNGWCFSAIEESDLFAKDYFEQHWILIIYYDRA